LEKAILTEILEGVSINNYWRKFLSIMNLIFRSCPHMHTDKQGGESGSLIFHEVLVDGCVPDEATQGAVVGGFGLGIEERYGSFGVGSG
jgi:hypothetical protein